MEVFFAPERTEITEYVFPEELQKLKGSDASGRNDNEPSDENLDSSGKKSGKIKKENQARLRLKRKWQAELEKDSGNKPVHTNQQERSPGSSESNANHFYATNNAIPERPNWRPHRSAPTSSYSNTPRQQFQRSSNSAQTGNSCVPQRQAPTSPASKYRTEVYQPQPSQFQPPQPDMSPFQPPSPLPYQQQPSQHIGYSQHFVQQQQPSQHIGYSQHFVQQQPSQHIGYSQHFVQQMHMFGQTTPLGPLSQAPHLSYAPPTITNPHPSTAFPPASPNFSYFSHPFPSAPSPGPSVSHQDPPSPGGMQVMSPMSPLSIQIPNDVGSPPSTMMTNGNNYHGSQNLLQLHLNAGSYGPMQRY